VKADLTRRSFDPFKHFSRVLMQQGRVQLDADWNEQAGILLHLLRRLTADQFGPAFLARFGGGFEILSLVTTTHPAGLVLDFGIQPGGFFVDGILCELEATPVPILHTADATKIIIAEWTVDGISFQVNQYIRLWDDRHNPGVPPSFSPLPLPVSQITDIGYTDKQLTLDAPPTTANLTRVQRLITYRSQPDLPKPLELQAGVDYLIYLDAWERLITCLEDDSIREVALNGPDTAARTRVVWQIKALAQQPSCIPQAALSGMLQPWTRGLLRARTQRDIYLLLTPEQRAQISDRRREREAHGPGGPPPP